MNLIDTNNVTQVLKAKPSLKDVYYLAPDVVDEVEMAQMVLSNRIPAELLDISTSVHFERGIYIKHYKDALNKYSGRSFYNMRGFGDVSILATIHMLLEVFKIKKTQQLFDPSEPVYVYTNDSELIKQINLEFKGLDVFVKTSL